MSDIFSTFHDSVCQGSHFIYSGHFEDSILFYQKIGFVKIHRENNFICVLRMKHIYIEIWDNDKKFQTTELSNSEENGLNSSLLIYINSLGNLNEILEHVKGIGIATDETGLKDIGHPLGYNFFITDPDKNRITFATGPVWSYPFYYEEQCRERLHNNLIKDKTIPSPTKDTDIQKKHNVIYPNFRDSDSSDLEPDNE